MRVLHLIDAASPQATGTTLAMLAESVDQADPFEQHVVVLGGPSLTRSAQIAGIHTAVSVGVPYGQAMLGWSSVRRHAQLHGPFDLIHCWSVGALFLAAVVFRTVPRILTLTVEPSPKTVRWLAALKREARGRTVLLPITSTIQQGVLSGGVEGSDVHLLRPGIAMGKIDPGTREALRKGWGAPSDHTKVLALLSDPTDAADTVAAGMAMIMAQNGWRTKGMQLRLLVHPNQANRFRFQRTARHMGRSTCVIQEPKLTHPWQVLPGCDLALAMGSHAGGLSLMWAMAGNIPVIGQATYAISEMVEDHHSALLAPPDSSPGIALGMTKLLTDPQLAWKLRDTARHEAYSFFSVHRYRQSIHTVYEQVAQGRANLEIPGVEATGGLRFAERS